MSMQLITESVTIDITPLLKICGLFTNGEPVELSIIPLYKFNSGAGNVYNTYLNNILHITYGEFKKYVPTDVYKLVPKKKLMHQYLHFLSCLTLYVYNKIPGNFISITFESMLHENNILMVTYKVVRKERKNGN